MALKLLERYLRKNENIAMIMTKNVVTISKKHSALAASRLLKRHKVGAVVVVDKKKLVGILSERDLITRVLAIARNPAHLPVSKIMTPKVYAARPNESISTVLHQMDRLHIRHVPVVNDQNVPVGMVSARDLMGRAQQRMKKLMHIKDHYITHDALTGL